MATAGPSGESLAPDPALVERFRTALNPLVPADAAVGLAISGGPDSLALLLLAAAARPGGVEAATVDHGFRSEATAEAEAVADLCRSLGVAHEVLTAKWEAVPVSGQPAKARAARYALLGEWAGRRGLRVLATAHHLDDQAETLLMRLNRGAGVRGLAAMRPLAKTPGSNLPLVRPLLGWRTAELRAICTAAAVVPAEDPSNQNKRFERARVRAAMAEAAWVDAEGLAASARHLRQADVALDWASERVWRSRVRRNGDRLSFNPADVPREIRRRVVGRLLGRLGKEGGKQPLRGREIDLLLSALVAGRKATLRGVLCSGGNRWTFAPAPPRSSA